MKQNNSEKLIMLCQVKSKIIDRWKQPE